MTEIIFAIVGLVVGGVVAGALVYVRLKSATQRQLADAESRAKGAESTVVELRNQVNTSEDKLNTLQEKLSGEQQTRVKAETELIESRRALAEERKLIEEAKKTLTDTFESLSHKALRTSSQEFLQQAKLSLEKVLTETKGEMGKHQEAVAGLMNPLKEALSRYEKQVLEMEKNRRGAYEGLGTKIEDLAKAHRALQQQTHTLAQALRSPTVRGRWGEITLQRVVELAGLSQHCDFDTQTTVQGEQGRQRPDLVVRLPGSRSIVVDAKAPLEAYLDAMDAEDPQLRRSKLVEHASAVRSHLRSLSQKSYWNQFETAPDFVILFLPGESFCSAALESDRTLIEDGIKSRVIISTPSTLILCLLTVAHTWQQQQLAENAKLIAEAGTELYNRLCTFARHMGGIRKGIESAAGSYNDAVGSWERRVEPGARKLKELGAAKADQELPEPGRVETTFRQLPEGEEKEG